MNNFSIRTLQAKMQNTPAPRTIKCIHFVHKSVVIKSHSEPGESYIDSHDYCNAMTKRIHKRTCHTCLLYKK
jgi:hypothetical protein